MSRPTTKADLLQQSTAQFHQLMGFVNALPEDQKYEDFPRGTLNRNICDVLAHLHHWHLLFLKWYRVGMAGEKPDMPAPGYTWRTTTELNKAIQQKYRNSRLTDIQSALTNSFQEMYRIMEHHTDEELFEKKRYHWTGTTSLGAYLVSAPSSHYNWALNLIKRANKGTALAGA